MHNENKYIISELNACVAECNHCFAACLGEKNIGMLANCIKLNRECADICQMTASILARGSEHSHLFLNICAAICTACADECERHSHEHCKACAAACRKCANACSASIMTI
jgi:hypothetical protein